MHPLHEDSVTVGVPLVVPVRTRLSKVDPFLQAIAVARRLTFADGLRDEAFNLNPNDLLIASADRAI